MKRSRLQGTIAGICLLVLIFDSGRALDGARSGMELCIKTVIPSLFPFFVLSIMLTNTLDGSSLCPVQIIGKCLGIPQTTVSIVIPAFLGGYPVGAKCVGDLYRSKQIDRQNAERLLAFCNNAGPSFLFGMVSGFFPERKSVWLLWIIHIISSVLTAVSFPSPTHCCKECETTSIRETKSVILSAVKAMTIVCCWIILFRMTIAFLEIWLFTMLPGWAQVLLTGILELTNGCCALLMIEDLSLRFVLCSCILAFGGICVLIQTASVIQGLSLRGYMKGKLIQTAYSFLLSCSVITGGYYAFAVILPVMGIILRKTQKRYGNPRSIPV